MNPINTIINTGNKLAILALADPSGKCRDMVRKWNTTRDKVRREQAASDALLIALYEAFDCADIGTRTPNQRAAMREFRKRFHQDDDGTWTRI